MQRLIKVVSGPDLVEGFRDWALGIIGSWVSGLGLRVLGFRV